MASQERPTGLKATKGIELLTLGTPNGVKASIMLEELKEAYGLEYTYQGINIGQNIQKEDWFTKLGPNGRIPVIVDHDKGGYAVMEGLGELHLAQLGLLNINSSYWEQLLTLDEAILNYLSRFYDPEYKFHFEDPIEATTAEQWMAWQHGGIGPMQGQANHFS
jgi:glutathione S-transferase